jgi:hypothetical protein
VTIPFCNFPKRWNVGSVLSREGRPFRSSKVHSVANHSKTIRAQAARRRCFLLDNKISRRSNIGKIKELEF